MTILSIITEPNPILKKISLPVPFVDDDVKKLLDNMLETMYHDSGVGLAAVQVGTLYRALVIDLQDRDDIVRMNGFYPLFLINPEIIKKSDELVIATEGCLSLPEQQIEMTRPSQVYIRFTDYHNNICELDAEGWLARVIQHEMDHLDGKLLIDYLTYVKRNIAIRKLRKLKNNYL